MKRKPYRPVRNAPTCDALFPTQYFVQFNAVGNLTRHNMRQARYLGWDGDITTDRENVAIFATKGSAQAAGKTAKRSLRGISTFTVSSRKVIAGKRPHE